MAGERISLVAPTFIDGLSQQGAVGNIVIATDSLGNTAEAEVLDVGTGETLGAEKVIGTDSDMTGANNWVNNSLGILDINSTVANRMYMLGDGGGDVAGLTAAFGLMGQLFSLDLKGRLVSGPSSSLRFGTKLGSIFYEFTPVGTEQNFPGYVNVQDNNTWEIGKSSPGFNGTGLSIGDVSGKQVLTPSTSGLITGPWTLTGAFDPNDILSVQIIPAGKRSSSTFYQSARR
ncbi:hypothetical protein KAR91_41315 [Candidatus Pacearchaeota archaeon]|nr:hypothetical protein [Candidatus Pacearchaeota archaeon]